MNKKAKFRSALIAYTVLAVLFVLFGAYMLAAEKNDVQSVRDRSSWKTVTNLQVDELEDSSAPVGIRRQYRFTVEDVADGDASLIFYTVHQLVKVQLDGETVYTLTAGEQGIGSSPSSNWVVIPLYPSDSGRQVTVTITPVYRSVINRAVEFSVGSEFDFFAHRFKVDLPSIVLSSLCIFVGLLMITVQLLMIVTRKTFSWDNFYLGCFSLFLGIWRVTDTRFSALLFENNTKALGYITIFALFILPVPLLLYIDELHGGKRRLLLRIAALTTSGVAFIAVLLQLFRVAELRETLVLCHIMLVVDVAVSVFSVVFHKPKNQREKNARLFVILLGVSSLLDLVYYYLAGTSSGMVITLSIFLFCAVFAFVVNISDISRKVYVDEKTKLYNKTKWDEITEEAAYGHETIGVMMIDLNNFKYTNDTLGHDVGDQLLVDFADLLRETAGGSEVLFRWGGDEFVVLYRKATEEKLAAFVSELQEAVAEHNRRRPEESLYFACGFVLSSEYPGLSVRELLAKADERMYVDKQNWHEQNVV